jgi:hypothetical protein
MVVLAQAIISHHRLVDIPLYQYHAPMLHTQLIVGEVSSSRPGGRQRVLLVFANNAVAKHTRGN